MHVSNEKKLFTRHPQCDSALKVLIDGGEILSVSYRVM